MSSLPNPVFSCILAPLIAASILLPRATDSTPTLPALLLPLNDTAALPGTESTDAWYPYSSSAPADPIPLPSDDTIPVNASSPGASRIVCSGDRYGRNLRYASCLEAYNRMDDSEAPKTYGDRDPAAPGSTAWDAVLPLRILSADALCALDISHSPHAPSDTIRPSLLKSHARSLLAVCVATPPSVGGVVSGLGDGGHLALRVTRYRPRVHCFGAGTGPPWRSCRDVVDGMPVGGEAIRFGPVGDVLSRVVVPWVRTTEERRCAITIDTVSGPDVSDFYKLWAAAIAVDTLCVVRGKAGMAVGNGIDGHLVVGLKDLALEPGISNVSTGSVDGMDGTA